jgi:ABC-2 type transport system permease protein
MTNPVVLLFRGLPSGASESQPVSFLLLPWLLLVVALMCSFLAVRHTRGDEEDGRLELVSATPAGRTAPLASTAVHGIGVAVLSGAVVALLFIGNGALAGATLTGACCTLVGTVFLGVGLVAGALMPSCAPPTRWRCGSWSARSPLPAPGMRSGRRTPTSPG